MESIPIGWNIFEFIYLHDQNKKTGQNKTSVYFFWPRQAFDANSVTNQSENFFVFE